jgi:hypothetical protein
MADIEDILVHAWNKDAVNLKPALDDIMTAKVAERMDDTFMDVAASVYGNTDGDPDNEPLDYDSDTDDNSDNEGTEDANEFEADNQE